MLKVLYIDKKFITMRKLPGSSVRIETVHDLPAGFIINHLDNAGSVVRVLAFGFDTIPAIGGVFKIAVENACAHQAFGDGLFIEAALEPCAAPSGSGTSGGDSG